MLRRNIFCICSTSLVLSILSVASESAHEVNVVVRPYAERGHVVLFLKIIVPDKNTKNRRLYHLFF